MKTMKTMNAAQMIDAIQWIEVSSEYATDTQRIMREERDALTLAVRSGDGQRIAAAMDETRRVARMWGVDLADVRMPVCAPAPDETTE